VVVWFNIQTIGSSDVIWSATGDTDITDNFIILRQSGTTEIEALYEAGNVRETLTSSGFGLATNRWHCARLSWDAANDFIFEVDGIEIDRANIEGTWAGGTSGAMQIGGWNSGSDRSDIYVDQVYVSNNPNTPQIWTAFGKPLIVPLVIKES
jgi:hypothetical protein